ncbi:MAG: GspE/PulE family protein [Geobacteraceae bacterium]|nr:GspE/PulE family protein [Geobacteraceae bacterium]
MENRVILTFRDGHKLEASLARPFRSQENSIEVSLDDGSGKFTFSFDELCCIGVVGKPALGPQCSGGECLEEVETITGEHYLVCAKANQQFRNGFYCTPADEETPFKSIFFTFHSIKVRILQRPVGEILEDNGHLSNQDLEEVLEEQRELRTLHGGSVHGKTSEIHHETIARVLQRKVNAPELQQNARVGDILVAAGLVTREELEKAIEAQEKNKKRKIGSLLIERGLISEDQLLTALANKFRMRFVDLDKVTPTPHALKALSRGMANQMQVLPIEAEGSRLVVATSEPTDSTIIDRLRFITNCNVELVVALPRQISAAIIKYYNTPEESVDVLISEMHGEQPTVVEQSEESKFIEPDSKVIQLVNKVLIDAYRKGASDIHFEPGLDKRPFVVRYRVDGDCFIAHQIPCTFKGAIISRLKIIANLDIAEHRKPQSGKIILMYERRKLEYRLEITPSVGGLEDAVLRLLTASKPLPIQDMGFSSLNLNRFKGIVAKPYGIILCAGPTGSGKTTTLHSALALINSPERKIWTAEDPVEIVQEGLRQVQVNTKIGFTFQEALRSFLRADPDVIMIGEMRDAETAKTAINASLTGHLVFSTLHTNSAPETIVRLIEMGMEPYNFADALLGVLAQRLARTLCEQCKEAYHPSRPEYDELVQHYGAELFEEHGMPPYTAELTLMRKAGCERCGDTGYRGRIAVHELLAGNPAIKDAIKTNATVETLREIAVLDGMRTLKMDGIQKVFQGLTDIKQVLKVCML